MVVGSWIYSSDHDKWKFDIAVVLVRGLVLVERKDFQTVVEEQQSTSDVRPCTLLVEMIKGKVIVISTRGKRSGYKKIDFQLEMGPLY